MPNHIVFTYLKDKKKKELIQADHSDLRTTMVNPSSVIGQRDFILNAHPNFMYTTLLNFPIKRTPAQSQNVLELFKSLGSTLQKDRISIAFRAFHEYAMQHAHLHTTAVLMNRRLIERDVIEHVRDYIIDKKNEQSEIILYGNDLNMLLFQMVEKVVHKRMTNLLSDALPGLNQVTHSSPNNEDAEENFVAPSISQSNKFVRGTGEFPQTSGGGSSSEATSSFSNMTEGKTVVPFIRERNRAEAVRNNIYRHDDLASTLCKFVLDVRKIELNAFSFPIRGQRTMPIASALSSGQLLLSEMEFLVATEIVSSQPLHSILSNDLQYAVEYEETGRALQERGQSFIRDEDTHTVTYSIAPENFSRFTTRPSTKPNVLGSLVLEERLIILASSSTALLTIRKQIFDATSNSYVDVSVSAVKTLSELMHAASDNTEALEHIQGVRAQMEEFTGIRAIALERHNAAVNEVTTTTRVALEMPNMDDLLFHDHFVLKIIQKLGLKITYSKDNSSTYFLFKALVMATSTVLMTSGTAGAFLFISSFLNEAADIGRSSLEVASPYTLSERALMHMEKLLNYMVPGMHSADGAWYSKLVTNGANIGSYLSAFLSDLIANFSKSIVTILDHLNQDRPIDHLPSGGGSGSGIANVGTDQTLSVLEPLKILSSTDYSETLVKEEAYSSAVKCIKR